MDESELLSRALNDLQITLPFSFKLKKEQEIAVRDLLKGKNVLAVLPTGFGKSAIYVFVRARNIEMNYQAAILVVSPLNSIIKDQIQEFAEQSYPAVDLSSLSTEEIRLCKFKVAFGTAEMMKKKVFRDILKDRTSPLHQSIVAVVVDESHTVETWTGKR